MLPQAAQAKETVQGDLKGAIELYGQAVKEAGARRALAAQALVHMAECCQKMGDAQSRKIHDPVLRDYHRSTAGVDGVTLGASRLEQLEENLRAVEAPPLDPATLEACDAVWNRLRGPVPKYNR